nr:hypothetical protein [Vallitaleaceae bacterium]
MKSRIITVLFIATILIFNGCSKQPELDIETPLQEDTTIPDTQEPTDVFNNAPYILTDFGATHVDPYPLKAVDSSGDNQLYIEDQSSDGIDKLDLFVLNLKEAVANKDDVLLLSLIATDIKYSFGADNGKESFTTTWQLDTDPANSELWPVLENLLIYGGKLLYADEYQIPYMYDDLNLDNFDGVAIGNAINMRASADVSSDIVGQINYDLVQTIEYSENTYDIEGI